MIRIRNTEWEHPSPRVAGRFWSGPRGRCRLPARGETGFVVIIKDGLFHRNTVAR